ncbi:MarR family transcriptional regulator [Dactylosporangium aurantiacum]|uniref:MarR family transcriptional regulator n=1 Tax=Dactylosporangium aurantiacum TaxID=35754 RepID=A0A9Q9INL3_9ACTN|nr:MarR family transcriptional regulator [Dactylosporangium aurantiacum]MDG6106190.1 MarR family transcriptional regulator [Dactylosporangium aurantiacum]UWZ58308.1 MarR family transcriptional regulator [Dactylosporangium aurantiacum]
MSDRDLEQALLLQGRIAAFVRAFGLHQPDRTPCGTPVPVSEAHAIGELDRDGSMTQSELARRLHLEKSTVSRLVAQLIGRDWVRRVKHDGDARVVRLELTAAGSRVAGELAAARAARFADLLRNIPEAQRPAVIDAVTTLVAAATRQPAPTGGTRG